MILFNLILLGWASCAASSTLTGSGTKFVKCGGLLSSSEERCFEVVLKEIVVAVGPDGTNDDVLIEICPDQDRKQCCTTNPLKSALSDDWSKNDNETWGESYFGPCKGKTFLVKNSLELTLSKSKTGLLTVRGIDIYTKSPDSKIKELERFQCGNFELGGSKPTKQVNVCRTGPYRYTGIDKMVVQMGADGTDDSVHAKICSDTNDVCCSNKMSNLFSDDWKANKLQTWTKSTFSDCAKVLFKVTNNPIFSMTKEGKDDMSVQSVEFYMSQLESHPPMSTKYACEGFSLSGDCKVASLCTYTFAKCVKSSVASDVAKSTLKTASTSITLTRTTPTSSITSTTTTPTTTTTTTTTKTTTTTTTTTTTATTTTTKSGGFFSNLFSGR